MLSLAQSVDLQSAPGAAAAGLTAGVAKKPVFR